MRPSYLNFRIANLTAEHGITLVGVARTTDYTRTNAYVGLSGPHRSRLTLDSSQNDSDNVVPIAREV